MHIRVILTPFPQTVIKLLLLWIFRWFEYMNDPDQNPFAPFKITFEFSSDYDSPLSFDVPTCSEAYVSINQP